MFMFKQFANNNSLIISPFFHFTSKTYFQISIYKTYHTVHPDGTAYGGSAILVKSSIRHTELPKYQTDEIQATSIEVQDGSGSLCISALYSPPKHNRFIAGGDFNAKHTVWGSGLTTTKRRELLKAISHLRLCFSSTGSPTYWSSDPTKIPDLIDFCVTKGIPKQSIK